MTEPLQRWMVKKAARRSVVVASAISGVVAARRLAGAPCVRVLTYHRFGHTALDPWCVAPEDFAAQMRWLAEQGTAVSLNDILQFARGQSVLREGSVLVTMDDGFSSVLKVAAPTLRRFGIPAIAYITTNVLGNADAGRGAGEDYLTWEQLHMLQEARVTIGSHGHTHQSMARIPPENARAEALHSKDLLEHHLGTPVTSFAYPFGMRRDESPQTAEIVASCGYESAFISQHGTIRRGTDPLRMPRIKVEAGEPLWMFKLVCQGGMDAWSLADRIL